MDLNLMMMMMMMMMMVMVMMDPEHGIRLRLNSHDVRGLREKRSQ